MSDSVVGPKVQDENGILLTNAVLFADPAGKKYTVALCNEPNCALQVYRNYSGQYKCRKHGTRISVRFAEVNTCRVK